MCRWFTCLAALFTSSILPAPAAADWFCLPPPPIRFEYRTVTKYRTEYRMEIKEVQRTVTRLVPETVVKEVKETVMDSDHLGTRTQARTRSSRP